MDKRVLTIQDISCIGQCSVTVALPIISAMGTETCVLPSAVLSTHTTGFNGYTFRDLTMDMPAIIDHWTREKQKFDIIYTGYIGNEEQLGYIEEIIDKCMFADGMFIVDPVMGDNGVLYKGFDRSFAEKMKMLCVKADIILPNLTEAGFMLNTEYKQSYDKRYIEELIYRLAEINNKSVVLTGVSFDPKYIGVAMLDEKKNNIEYYFRERIGGSYHGTGDVFASTLTGAIAKGKSLSDAAKLAADFVAEAIRKTDTVNHWYGVSFEKALGSLAAKLAEK